MVYFLQSAACKLSALAAFDCPDLYLPANMFSQREGNIMVVKCNDTQETWFLTCQDSEWIGHIGKCCPSRPSKLHVDRWLSRDHIYACMMHKDRLVTTHKTLNCNNDDSQCVLVLLILAAFQQSRKWCLERELHLRQRKSRHPRMTDWVEVNVTLMFQPCVQYCNYSMAFNDVELFVFPIEIVAVLVIATALVLCGIVRTAGYIYARM